MAAIGLLADELRQRLYRFVRPQPTPVTRDQAAAAAGISRKLAAFHLDKLVAAGLLEAVTPTRPAAAAAYLTARRANGARKLDSMQFLAATLARLAADRSKNDRKRRSRSGGPPHPRDASRPPTRA